MQVDFDFLGLLRIYSQKIGNKKKVKIYFVVV
jgi:hypothetical protein